VARSKAESADYGHAKPPARPDGKEAVMTEQSDRHRAIARRMDTAFARDRVASALYEALLDGLRIGVAEVRGDDREWLRGAIAVPLQDATDAAIDCLTWEVTIAFEQAPSGLVDRLEHGRRWSGLEIGAVT
jgi:hypothetical protein